MDLFGYTLYIDFDEKKMVLNDETAYFAGEEGLSARIFIDYGAVEIFADNGLLYFPCGFDTEALEGSIEIKGNSSIRLDDITVYSIASSQIKYPSYKPDISSYR